MAMHDDDDDDEDWTRFWRGALLGAALGAPLTFAMIWGLWIIVVAAVGDP